MSKNSKITTAHNRQERIEWAYRQIRGIYREKGLRYSFYISYRILTCPIKRIFHLIPEGLNYVDVGCGYGLISLWIALAFQHVNVIGIDVVKSRIEFCRKLADEAGVKNLRFCVTDITKETIDNSEIILLINLLHHIPFADQLSVLKQCINKTSRGGYIVFKDIDRTPSWKYLVNYIQDDLLRREKTYCRSKDEYMKFFKKNGFEAEYFDLKRHYPYSHYLIRARKL